MTLTCFILLCVPAAVQVTVAPDQPMPFVYFDDPLILEVYSDKDVQVSGTLQFSSVLSGDQADAAVTPFHVYANTPYWYVVAESPKERGYFNLDISFICDGEEYKQSTHFCRIDRPAALQHIPLYAHCGGDSRTCFLNAARSIGIETFHFAASSEYLDELADEASLFGLHIVLGLTPGQLQKAPDYLADVIEKRCENILRFEVNCKGIEPECNALMDSFRQTGCPASMSVVVSSAKQYSELMAESPHLSVRHVSLISERWPDPVEVLNIRHIAAQHGLEGIQIHVANPGWYPRSKEPAAYFLHRFFQYRSVSASHIGLNAAVFADDMGIQEMLAYLNGLALHFSRQSYVGNCILHQQVSAPLFRSGSDWLAVVWSEKTGKSVTLPIHGAINVTLSDAFGNPMKINESDGSEITLDCSPLPLYLTGTGGALLGSAAANELKAQASYFMAQVELTQAIQGALVERIQKMTTDPPATDGRLRFLEFMSALPLLEEQWHTRQVPKHIIVPAIMQITDMAKTMAVLEEDRGENFLEPLTEILNRTEESQSLYLVGSAGTAKSRERGDWILSEVRRLVEESELMEKSGRKIEAVAIALLAEARSLCLKPAAQADAPQEAPEILPQPVVPAETLQEGEPSEEAATSESEEKPKEATPKKQDVSEEETAGQEGELEEGIHVVVSGDNPYDIAKKYNIGLDDLLKWNNLTKKSIIHIGQKLNVRPQKSE